MNAMINNTLDSLVFFSINSKYSQKLGHNKSQSSLDRTVQVYIIVGYKTPRVVECTILLDIQR